jgi:SAM-dependent methyltransferase
MHQADPIAILEADLETTLLLDRRERHLADAARASGLVLAGVWKLPSPEDESPIYVGLLRPPSRKNDATVSDPFPKRIECADTAYLRFVDRLYLPAGPDLRVSAALFDLIARVYDRLTSHDVNVETALILLQEVLGRYDVNAFRILDFGCGTGLALEAARRLERPSNDLELIGTDVSQKMLEIAARRGETVLRLDQWRALPNNSFDGAISAFVFHFGVPREDLNRIALQLRPGARLAANYFKANAQAVEMLVSELAQCGLVFERMEALATTPRSENTLLVFSKSPRAC